MRGGVYRRDFRLLPVLLLALGCSGGNAASQLVKAPVFEPKNETRCAVVKSQERPLIVEWPASDRLALETQARRSLVVVRYLGCEMAVLDRCNVKAKYSYAGATRVRDRVEIRDADDLYAKLPLGAAGLESNLQRAGMLTLDMNLVGRYESERSKLSADELVGECEGATHFVYGITVGAFDLHTGGSAHVGGSVGVDAVGVGANSSASRDSLSQTGDEVACSKATSEDTRPPEDCGALIRLEVVPLGAPQQAAPNCPNGTAWNGSACVQPASAAPAATRVAPRPPSAESSCRLAISDAESNSNMNNLGGHWFAFRDTNGTVIQPMSGVDGGTFFMTQGGSAGTTHAARMSGRTGGGDVVFAGMGTAFTDPKGPYDAHRYAGIAFDAKRGANSTGRVRLKLGDSQTDPDGRKCAQCFNDFGANLDLTTDWRHYNIPFSSLRQQEWGPKNQRVDTSALYGIQFQVAEAGAAFDIWVDQVEFTGCS